MTGQQANGKPNQGPKHRNDREVRSEPNDRQRKKGRSPERIGKKARRAGRIGKLTASLLLILPILPIHGGSVFAVSAADRASGSSAPAAKAGQGPRDAAEVQAFLDDFFARDDIAKPGGAAAVSVVQNGRVLASRTYGEAAQMPGGTTEARDRFRIGSVSKVFTAAAVMQLVDQGRISLDDDIELYLDGYTLNNPYGKKVTVGDLLTHTTGFEVREPPDAGYVTDRSRKPVSLAESVFEVFPPVVREPGTSYMYDNFASRLQGYLVQQVSGESFGSYMDNHLFRPLGMTSSDFSLTEADERHLVPSYGPDAEAIPVYRFSPEEWPEGSMVSTADDMASFIQMLQNGGRTKTGETVLSPESVQAMMTYQAAIHPSLPDTTYGLEGAVVPSKTNGERVVSKGGDIQGYSSLLWLLPDRSTGVFVSYNANSELRSELFTAFMDRYYPGKSIYRAAPGFQPNSRQELARFTGLYSDLRIKLFTRIETDGDGSLVVSDLFSRHRLKQIGELLFVDEQGAPLAFKADPDGQIIDMKYSNLFSYSVKVPEHPAAFLDVPAEHPYAPYILPLKSLGYTGGEASQPFRPEETVSRGAFIQAFNAVWSLPPSPNPPLFKDTVRSPYGRDIQAAVEAGLLSGTGSGLFEPDRPIRREEAASIVVRLLAVTGIRQPDPSARLKPGASDWAAQAVSSAVLWKLHGPEVTESAGKSDYKPQQPLLKQELAALLFTMLEPQ
ncbi:serine hydrolase [Saccharibacillus qingshengii]|uniref:serine hydrolase n=1 Tax=Saccharibacillus qingshengii TaxID=1763540 RepID=UPI001557DF1C|nr:serine hydrolase [Saccharibacillus qingshengii]